MKNKVLEYIYIKKFRALKNVKLNNISKINVVVGQNNSGKTSILEAIQLIANPFSSMYVRRIAQQRNYSKRYMGPISNSFTLEDYLFWLFPQTRKGTDSIELEYQIGKDEHTLQFDLKEILYEKLVEDIDIIENSEDLIVKELNIDVKRDDQTKELNFFQTNAGTHQTLNREDELLMESIFANSYISAIEHKISTVSPQQIGKIILKNKKNDFLEHIQSFDNRIETIEIIPREIKIGPRERVVNEIYIKQYEQKELLPMFVYGDGLQKIMLIASRIMGSENGVLLIDEVETGIHTEHLKKYFSWLYELAEEYNVTLFLTTHSLEAVDNIIYSSEKLEDFSFYRLANEKIKYFSGEKIYSLRNDFGQDVRY